MRILLVCTCLLTVTMFGTSTANADTKFAPGHPFEGKETVYDQVNKMHDEAQAKWDAGNYVDGWIQMRDANVVEVKNSRCCSEQSVTPDSQSKMIRQIWSGDGKELFALMKSDKLTAKEKREINEYFLDGVLFNYKSKKRK